MRALPSRVLGGVMALSLAASLSAAPTAATYSIDSKRSWLTVTAGKRGLFKAFAHDHVIRATQMTGSANFDDRHLERASVNFVVEAASLTVIDPGESDSDRQRVQATMLGDKVLDVDRFPEIRFASSAVSTALQTADGWDLDVVGVLILHGIERPVRVPVHIAVDRGVMHARGEVVVRQTDFGMTPVTAAGGMVKVKDEVTVSFEIVAASTQGSHTYTIAPS